MPSARSWPAKPAHPSKQRAVLEGTTLLSDQELVALVLDPTGRNHSAWETSNRLVAGSGGLARLARFRARGLAAHADVSETDAVRVLAAMELGHRVERESRVAVTGEPLTAAGVFAWAQPRLGALEHEELWVLCVDARTRLRSTWQAGRGGLHGCAVLPRDVLMPVVREAAAAFVVVHNHPSGDPSPSAEDVAFTRALAKGGAALSIPLLDHVVVGGGAYRSLLDAGLL